MFDVRSESHQLELCLGRLLHVVVFKFLIVVVTVVAI